MLVKVNDKKWKNILILKIKLKIFYRPKMKVEHDANCKDTYCQKEQHNVYICFDFECYHIYN